MPSSFRRGGRGFVFVPASIFEPGLTITITDDDGDVHDVTAFAGSVHVMRQSLRFGIGDCGFLLMNPEGKFTDLIDGGETVKIYFDYSGGAAQVAEGRVYIRQFGLSSDGYYLQVSARERPELAENGLIYKSFSDENINTAIQEVMDEYFPTLTYTGLTSTDSVLTQEFRGVSFLTFMRYCLTKSGQDGYFDFSGDLNTNNQGENKNTAEKVIHGQNLAANFNGIGHNWDNEKNRTTAIGRAIKDSNAVIPISTEEDTTSQANLWLKPQIIYDASLGSLAGTADAADFYQEANGTTYLKGRLPAVGGLPTLLPGQSIQCSVPYCKVNGWYEITKYEHDFGMVPYNTHVEISEPMSSLAKHLRQNITYLARLEQYQNNNNFLDSFIMPCDAESEFSVLTDCEVSTNALRITGAATTATATSTTESLDRTITQVELRFYGEDMDDSTVEVSIDNGVSYQTVTNGVVATFTSSSSAIIVRVNFVVTSTSVSPKIHAMEVLY